ncbi:hypothetical protein IWX46DRAFT_585681 [Phyllosticta citricarpa]|uniref:Uncharacterized protein n=1 Tax=Phyllosticta citricarpa TaxID=55181 RepID=A0ABR1L5H7_9PEZI
MRTRSTRRTLLVATTKTMEWHLVAPEPRQTGKTDRANQQLLLDAFLAHVCLCCMTWRPYSVFSPHLNTTHLSPSSPLRPSMTDTVQQQNRERIWRACDNKDGHDPAAVAQIWRWMARTRFSADTPASACRELLAIFNLAPNSGMNAEQHMKALETALLQRIRGNELKHLQDHGLIDAAGCWDGDTVVSAASNNRSLSTSRHGCPVSGKTCSALSAPCGSSKRATKLPMRCVTTTGGASGTLADDMRRAIDAWQIEMASKLDRVFNATTLWALRMGQAEQLEGELERSQEPGRGAG